MSLVKDRFEELYEVNPLSSKLFAYYIARITKDDEMHTEMLCLLFDRTEAQLCKADDDLKRVISKYNKQDGDKFIRLKLVP